MTRTCFAILTACLALPVQAAIYKVTDAEGNVTFTDRYRPGAVKLVDTAESATSSATTTSKRPTSSRANPSPANFPKVDKQTQNKRDDVRRTLLLEERKNEESALAGIRAMLGDGKKRAPAELTKLSESQRLHEKNIEMLDKEIARIR